MINQTFLDYLRPMIQLLKTAFRYIKYYVSSNTLHGTHSPFVYSFLENVVYDKAVFPVYERIEKYRNLLKKDNREIIITDLGAGSKVNNDKKRTVGDIASHSLKPAKYAQLIYRLIRHFKPEYSIELGTSLGITSAYMSEGNPSGQLITMEGCPATLAIAKKNFEALGLTNIRTVAGNFNETFPGVLSDMERVDLVFFDGNHQKNATLQYFYQALEKSTIDSIFIFDDIYWSDGMKEAWEEVKNNSQVKVTIDLFFIGIVFFRGGQAKENFVIKY